MEHRDFVRKGINYLIETLQINTHFVIALTVVIID